jgi:thioredoxin 1
MVSKTASLVLLFCLSATDAFVPSSSSSARQRAIRVVGVVPTTTQLQAVIEIGSEADFDKTIKDSGSALVIVDYSTTWCGPCKGMFFVSPSCDARFGISKFL